MKDKNNTSKGANAGFGSFAAKQMLPLVIAVVVVIALELLGERLPPVWSYR